MRFRRVAFFVAAAAAIPLVECEQVLNLDQWSLADGSTTTDASDATTVDVIISDALPPDDAFQLPDGVSEASSWANWRMVNTLAEVLDGASDASLPDFNTTDAGILDNRTKLLWSLNLFADVTTIEDAVADCASIQMRLPTRIELVTLIDTTKMNGPYAAPPFALTTANYWTSSYVRPIKNNTLVYWMVSFSQGDVINQSTSGDLICVR